MFIYPRTLLPIYIVHLYKDIINCRDIPHTISSPQPCPCCRSCLHLHLHLLLQASLQSYVVLYTQGLPEQMRRREHHATLAADHSALRVHCNNPRPCLKTNGEYTTFEKTPLCRPSLVNGIKLLLMRPSDCRHLFFLHKVLRVPRRCLAYAASKVDLANVKQLERARLSIAGELNLALVCSNFV